VTEMGDHFLEAYLPMSKSEKHYLTPHNSVIGKSLDEGVT